MKKILVAHDGSKYSQKAMKKAIELAAPFGATLIVLSVVPEMRLTELSPIDQERLREAMEKEAKKTLQKAKISASKTKVPIKTIVKQGNAADVIVETADRLRVGMIVIGSHGWHGVQRFLLGSISLNVVEQSRRPVLVVK